MERGSSLTYALWSNRKVAESRALESGSVAPAHSSATISKMVVIIAHSTLCIQSRVGGKYLKKQLCLY